MSRRPTRLAAGLVALFGCSIGDPDTGDGCSPCSDHDIVFEEVAEPDAHHVRVPVEPPLRLAAGAIVDLDVDGAYADVSEYEVDREGVVERLPGAPLRLQGQAEGSASLEVADTCDRAAGLKVEVVPPAAIDPAVTATVEPSPLLLPAAAAAAGVGLLPGGAVVLGPIARDAAGGKLAGILPVEWSTGLPAEIPASPYVQLDWRVDFAPAAVAAPAPGASIAIEAVPAGSATSLGLARLDRGVLVDGPLELLAGGGVVDLAAFARDASGRLLRGFDDRGFAAEVDDPAVAVVGEPPDRTGPLFSLVGLEPGATLLRVHGHGRELAVPVTVVDR